jgi:RNA polymerase sigma factor (sigma-70 family)
MIKYRHIYRILYRFLRMGHHRFFMDRLISAKYFRVFHVTICTFTSNHNREQNNQTVENIPDELIMQHVRDGNLTEMSVLFERYHVRLYNFFLKLGMKNDISQDLTQNLFYRMIKYRQTYKNESSVKSWMFQIARNLHIDYRKQQKKSDDLLMITDTYPTEVIDDGDDYTSEEYERLDRALSDLKEDQKEILVLSRYQGLKYEEISSITHQSVPAIKVAVHRAIKQLRGIYFKQI